MRRRQLPGHGFLQGSSSSPRSPVLLQRAQCDVIGGGEELTHSVAGRPDAALLSLCWQRQLLTLVREFVVHQMNVLEYYRMVERRPRCGLEAACLRLQELCQGGALLQRRVRQLLRPLSSPVLRALGNMHRTLQFLSVKAATVTESLVLCAVRRAACFPAGAPEGLSRALTVYNKVIAEVAAPGADMRPMSITRCLEVVAEERAWLLIGRLSQADLCHWLEDVLRGEEASQGEELSSHLEILIREDQCQVAPLLTTLSGVEGRSLCAAESLLYEQYCSLLWSLLCTHLFQALYPGRRGVHTMPALAPCAAGETIAAISQILLSVLTSDAVSEQHQEPSRRLYRHLLCTAAQISWDTGMCRALSSALTDKCVTPLLDNGAPRTHSRTSAALVTVCQELTVLLQALSSGDVSSQHGALSCCVTTFQLCELWLRSRSQMYTSSGSLSPLLLISHGDVPVIMEQMRSVMSAAHKVEAPPASRRLRVTLQNGSQRLEGVALCLPRLLASMFAHQAQDIFQHTMPGGRHWRGKVARSERRGGPDLVPSDYARGAVHALLAPLLEGLHLLSLEGQVSAMSTTVGSFMEAWMEHILQERLRFSLQGALQLRCDFESVRDLLRSQELGLSPEVLQAALSLPVFQQADNAIVCLLQQPSRKAYLQSHGCSVFCCPPLCRSAVESVSDSLQSLDSLGRRVWSHNYPAPRHSHDSYLPHHQRQWLSLRLHKGWS